ncbi:MAG: TlpA family protein disulfide reductase [Chromatiaceae bacterium]|jgi:thiol-disulfide isomerase/thioredoxin|nr:TlpA family protein disulfide reductase [Chromatiaceae bacterium]
MLRLDTRFFPAGPIIGLLVSLLIGNAPVAAAEDNFTLPGLDGQEHSLSDYRGSWVLVNYWATWCPPCLEELPELEVFHSGAQGKAVVLGVNMEAISRPRLRDFTEQQFLSYPILIATEQPRREQLLGPVEGLPTSYLVTPSGEVVARQVGPITAKAINDFIDNYESGKAGGAK